VALLLFGPFATRTFECSRVLTKICVNTFWRLCWGSNLESLVIKATEFFYSSPVLIDLLFWFALVIASGLFKPIANIIVVLHQAAQADCTLLCLLLYIKDQKKRQSVGY